jgi:ribosome-associated toxin RatA of RatAB toxin-antitoxin module
MPTIEKEIIINRDKEFLFDLSQDYEKRLVWDKYLAKAVLLDSNEPVVGGKVYCEIQKGIGMTIQYITFKRPVQTAMEMIEGPFVLKNFSGSWRFIEVDKNQTKVIFRYNFKTKCIPFILDKIVGTLLKTDLNKRLTMMKNFAENN